MDMPPHPAPHSVSEDELRSIKACLIRWRSEVENNMNGDLKPSEPTTAFISIIIVLPVKLGCMALAVTMLCLESLSVCVCVCTCRRCTK